MSKYLSEKNKVKPKRILATMLAFVQLFLLFPAAGPMGVMAAGGNVEYVRINPEVAIYNAQTGIDEKLYEQEISGSSQFNAATKSSLFGLLVLCQDNGHIKPLFFSKISKMHKLVAFIPRFA